MRTYLRFYTLLIVCITCFGCFNERIVATSIPDTLTAGSLWPVGRAWMTPDQQLELIGSAAHFGFSFEGPECQLFVSVPQQGSHNYLQYEMDGKYGQRVRINGGTTTPLTLRASGKGRHIVWVYKATEAHTGPILIRKVMGKKVRPLQRPAAPLIEFVGNSITCGAAADPSEVPCGTGVYHDQHNAYAAYGPRVARALGANFIMSSVSGIGIYRNWNSDGPSMPQVYASADFSANGTRPWDFTQYRPDVVSIALGTNDFSSGDGKRPRLPFDSAAFIRSYVQFVQGVKSRYPDAQIALLNSPMVKGQNRELLHQCLASVKNSVDAANPIGKQVALFFFKPMEARGCSGHPSVEDHLILAAEVAPFFRGLLP